MMSARQISPVTRGVFAFLVMLACATGAPLVSQAKPNWDRAANIREAAHRLVGIHSQRGALGTLKYIADCYQTQMLAEHYAAPLEACIAQDYMLSQTLALIYDRLPPDKRQEMGVAEPAQIARGLSQRVGTALNHYKLTQADADALQKLVEKEGLPVFFKERFSKPQ